MLSKEKINIVLTEALKSGADFAEIFVEDTTKNNISLNNGRVENIISGRDYGIGIRIFKGFRCIYAYTSDDSLDNLKITARKAAYALGKIDDNMSINLNLIEKINSNIHPVLYVPKYIETSRKIEKLKEAYKAAKEFSHDIKQVTNEIIDKDQKVLIANSEGLITRDRRIYTRMVTSSVASDGIQNQQGYEAPGAMMGFEIFDQFIDIEKSAKTASEIASVMLHADYCPAGRMPVAIENGFGGVIFHEACGHSLEATAIAKGNSVFCNKLGEQIASTKVTAIDDGTIKNLWGSMNIDDEGTKSKKNVLIENGILKGYLVDKLNARRMGVDSTGSSRRESYKFAPTSRMTNTYIANGNDKNEDIIKSIDYGIYAKKMGGGSVNPITGEFNFAVLEGYIVKNGVIQKPVRGASLIGKGSEVLMDIDMVGQNLDHGQGMCGSSSGSVPTNVGQPLIRVKEITVGGR